MITALEATLDGLGLAIEVVLVDAGSGGCAIVHDQGGSRGLATVVGPSVPPEATRVHSGWDLDLLSLPGVETPNGPRRVLIENLPLGVPSIGPAAPGWTGLGVPAFVIALVERVARVHARGEVVGALHPALVFVDPRSSTFVATAQRPIRVAAAAPSGDGELPLFGLEYAAPSDIRNRPPTAADDAHRVAAMTWRWRHGVAPFDGLSEAALMQRLAGVPSGPRGTSQVPLASPADALDAVLVRAITPDAANAPTAAELLESLLATGSSWNPSG